MSHRPGCQRAPVSLFCPLVEFQLHSAFLPVRVSRKAVWVLAAGKGGSPGEAEHPVYPRGTSRTLNLLVLPFLFLSFLFLLPSPGRTCRQCQKTAAAPSSGEESQTPLPPSPSLRHHPAPPANTVKAPSCPAWSPGEGPVVMGLGDPRERPLGGKGPKASLGQLSPLLYTTCSSSLLSSKGSFPGWIGC